MLDELFAIRCALASLSQERDAAILGHLPPEFQEVVSSILREFADMQEQREQADNVLAGQIRLAVKTLGLPVLGTHLQAGYQPGRRSWDSDGLERLAVREPEILTYRRQGEAIVTIRARAQHRRTTPLLYDTHTS